MKEPRCFLLAIILSLMVFSTSALAVPISIPGVAITSQDADYTAITKILGVGAKSDLVCFDLAVLSLNPTAFLAIDDGVPASGAPSSLLYSGIDLDAVGAISSIDGKPMYATSAHSFVPGERISASAESTALDNESYIDDPAYTNRTAAKTGGTGGDGYLFGTIDDVLGAPDAPNPFLGGINSEGNFLSLGSGGQISLLFGEPINRNANVGGTIYDLVFFDVGGSNDLAFFFVDEEPGPPVPIPATIFLLGSGLLGVATIKKKLKK